MQNLNFNRFGVSRPKICSNEQVRSLNFYLDTINVTRCTFSIFALGKNFISSVYKQVMSKIRFQ